MLLFRSAWVGLRRQVAGRKVNVNSPTFHVCKCLAKLVINTWGRLYAKSNAIIAIQTTYSKLRDALPASFHIGEVNYVDHQTYLKDEKEGFFSVMCKRKSFEHERELRICYVDSYEFQQDSKDAQRFLREANTRLLESVPVDVQVLIESVRIAPGEPAWFVELVKDTLIRFGYRLPVCQSGFDEYPLF